MQVEALKDFSYNRRRYRRGDIVLVSDRDGELLVYAGTATLAPDAVQDSEPVELSPRTGKPKRQYRKRQYNRRDMVAE